MTTAPIDPNIRADVIRMARNGAGLRQIGHETGLLDKEIRLIIDAEKMRLAQNPTTAPARKQLPPTKPAGTQRLPSGAVRPPAAPPAAAPASRPTGPPVAPPQPTYAPPRAQDGIAALIDQAEASDIAKVRTAVRRVVGALDNLKEVMAATETERREKAAAKAAAERQRTERKAAAERERAARERRAQEARDAVAAAEAALAKAKADLKGLRGSKPPTKPSGRGPLTGDALEAARARMKVARAARNQKAATG